MGALGSVYGHSIRKSNHLICEINPYTQKNPYLGNKIPAPIP
jgi:hypothetical protein